MKKILVMSDSHLCGARVKQAIEEEIPDMLIHLGDSEEDPDIIQEWLEATVNSHYDRPLDGYIKSLYIKGNSDRFYKRKMTPGIVFELNGHTVLATHGHGFYVDYGLDDLLAVAKEKNCDIVMYGHTHEYFNEEIEGIRFLNPGSIAFPRKNDVPSYMIITFDDSGNYNVEKKIPWCNRKKNDLKNGLWG